MFILSSAHASNLNQSKIVSFGNELKEQNRTEHIFFWNSTSVHSQILHELYNKAFESDKYFEGDDLLLCSLSKCCCLSEKCKQNETKRQTKDNYTWQVLT